MSWYIGRHAELYDIFYAQKSYPTEAAFIDRCLKEFSPQKPSHLLELACGTGEHAFALEKRGYKITATDGSASMLAQANKKRLQRKSDVMFRERDMREIAELPGDFDAAVCMFDSIGYVQSDDALMKVFGGVRSKIPDKGVFLFEFWHAPAMLQHYEKSRVRNFETPNSKIIRISETELDAAKSVAHVHYQISETRHDGSMWHMKEIHTNRFFHLPEMESLLQLNGFTPVKSFSGFDWSAKVTDETWHVVTVARKA